MSKPMLPAAAVLLLFLLLGSTDARDPHVINFRSPNLYPESLTWDPKSEHFIVGSLRYPIIQSVSDAGVTSTLISDDSIPANSSFLGVTIDRFSRRLLAVVHCHSAPPFNALAAYDLSTHHRLFLAELDSASVANDVAVDSSGTAYVTDSGNDVIYKVTVDGEASVLSSSPVFKSSPVDHTTPYHECGLNGIVYNPKGYLLVVQSNTGKLYKVHVDDGRAKRVLLNRNLTAADGIAVRSDGVVVAVSQHALHYIKSDNSWSEGVVFDETALEVERHASGVTVGAENRVYVLYGHVNEGLTGNSEREEFSIVQIQSEKENKEENVWIFILIGLGLAYFLFWRFQMAQLAKQLNKKNE